MEQFESAFEMYRQMAANIPDCSIYIFDHDYDYLLAEGEEITKLGVENENLIGTNFFEVWPQEVTMTLSPYYLDTLNGKRQKLEQQTENGIFIQHFIPIMGPGDEVLAGMVVSQNISLLSAVKKELSARDKELEEKQRLLETVINTVGEGIIAANDKEEIVLSNPAADRLFGFSLKNKTLTEIREATRTKRGDSDTPLQGNQLPIGMALEGAAVDAYTLQLENLADNRTVHTENSSRPLRDAENRVTGAVLITRNISARKELEELLEENLAALKQKNARLEHFVTKLTQNLLGPTANLSILYSLLQNATDMEEKEAVINKIGEVAGILQHSVGNLKEAMVSYTSSHEKWGANRFREVLDGACNSYRDEMEGKTVTFDCNFDAAQEVMYPINDFEILMKELLIGVWQLCHEGSRAAFSSYTSGRSVGIKVRMDSPMATQPTTDELTKLAPALQKAARQIESLGGSFAIENKTINIIF